MSGMTPEETGAILELDEFDLSKRMKTPWRLIVGDGEPMEMVRFVLGHIESVEVLEPAELREAVKAKLALGSARYGLAVSPT
jgi:predicted DNA-binding transcriptional regulator YafY